MAPQAPDLPAIEEGLLGPAELQALFADLAARAAVTGIATKGGETARAEVGKVGPLTLAEAQAGLAARTVHGVQVRYLFAGREWCDTLLREGEQVRLVRMELSRPTAPRPGPTPETSRV